MMKKRKLFHKGSIALVCLCIVLMCYNATLEVEKLKQEEVRIIEEEKLKATNIENKPPNPKDSNGNCIPTFINDILIVNKTYCLPSDYISPKKKQADIASTKMISSAKTDGINLKILSGHRSYETQVTTFSHWQNTLGDSATDVSAKEGHSEHQTGLTFDFGGASGCELDTCFETTSEGKWLKINASKFGFILRYPKGKEGITEYSFEPWHFRYVGIEQAGEIDTLGVSLEEYLGLDAKTP